MHRIPSSLPTRQGRNKYIIHQFFVPSRGISSAGALRVRRIFRLISRVYLTDEDRVCRGERHPERGTERERERGGGSFLDQAVAENVFSFRTVCLSGYLRVDY